MKRIERLSPGVLFHVQTRQPAVALTLDDGPDPASTPAILDLLQRYQARCTFFVLSNKVPGNEALMRRIVNEGHELGNHLPEDYPSIRLSADRFSRSLSEAHAILTRFGPVRWFRPGSGWYNPPMLRAGRDLGYGCALGSAHPFDRHLPFRWFAVRHLLWRSFPGAILVLHDGKGPGARTEEILARLLPELQRRQLRVITLSELVRISEEELRYAHDP